MSRIKLSEYRAKSLLAKNYKGVSITLDNIDEDIAKLDQKDRYIIKVDQGVKKRGKQGLVKLNIKKNLAKDAVLDLADHGFNQFIAEPMLDHGDDEERYLSIERKRDGFQILYSSRGGVDVEDNPESIEKYDDYKKVPINQDFLRDTVEAMDKENFSFVEINPLVIRGDKCLLLDAAVLVDSAGENASSWSSSDAVENRQYSGAETSVAELNDNSPASFSFRVLNPNGSIWLLLSGGGASITIADEAANKNKAELIGNYGEYSGGPTSEETQVYTEAVLKQVIDSTSSKKALVIAGGVANFTDVKKTFVGIIKALEDNIESLKYSKTKVFVRRGGPNEQEGLAMMREFLKQHGLYGSVHGSQDVLTSVVDEALEYVDA